jgi:hypothetical protein
LASDAIGFLSKNIIYTPSPSEKGVPTSATRLFDFKIVTQTTQGGSVYQYVAGDKLINGALDVVYLPWGANTGYYVILEPDGGPDIFLTAQMDGCAVGYARSEDGHVRVSHHNMAADGEGMDAAQKLTLAGYQNTFHNSDYRYNDVKSAKSMFGTATISKREGIAFVVGVRASRQWTLYCQKVESAMQTKGNVTTGSTSITSVAVF